MKLMTGGRTVRFAVRLELFQEAVIVTAVEVVTPETVIGKVAELAPAGTVTVAGTVAVAHDDDSATTAPPAGAGVFRVTVLLLTVVGPVADELVRDREAMPAGKVSDTFAVVSWETEMPDATASAKPVAWAVTV